MRLAHRDWCARDGLNIAPNRVIAIWSAQWTPKLSAFLQGQYAFSPNFDEAAKEFSGYALFDLGVDYRLAKGKVNLGIATLFDRQYITYYSQSALIEPAGYLAGRVRTVTLGYSLDF